MIGVLLLAAVLAAPLTAAAEPGARKDQQSWGLLARLWSALTAVWAEGCKMDPFGVCETSTATLEPTNNLDNGCKIDPFGGCAENNIAPEPTNSLDEGCKIDPYGGCRDNN